MERTSFVRPIRFESGLRGIRHGTALLLVLALASAAGATGGNAGGPGSLPVTEVTVFKDGHALVLHQGRLPVNDDGDVVTGTVPAPVLGTLWSYTTTEDARLAGVVAGEREVERLPAARDLRELLEANVGAEAVLRFDLETDSKRLRKGRILDLPRSPEGERGDLVLLDCDDGVRAFAVSRVVEAVFPQAPQTVLATRQREKLLRFHLDWQGRPRAEAEVGMAYLQKGLRWIPSYRVEIDGNGGAVLRLQATLVNELADLHDTVVHLVVGVPSFRFAESLDPMAMEEALEDLGQHFRQSSQTASVFSNVVMSQAVLPVSQGMEAEPQGTDLDDPNKSEDLYVFSLERLSLAKGERMTVSLAQTTVRYRDVYTLHLAPSPPAEVWQQYGRGQQQELARLTEVPKVEHAIRITNSGPHPLTTAPAMILENGRLLGQGMTTYSPVGADSDLAITTAVDIPVLKREHEVGRTHDAVTWEGHRYARIDLEGTITLTNRGAGTAAVEVTRQVLGMAESASHGGTIERTNVLEEASLASGRSQWWQWYSWPYWWDHFNGVGVIRWTVALDPGETVDLDYAWDYYWR